MRTALVDNLEQFTLLEREWDDLFWSARGVTPFQSWAWMYSWWEAYGVDYELRIIAVYDDADLLVGLVPLMLEHRWGLARLLFVGTRSNDYQDILVREGCEDEVAETVRVVLRQLAGWQVTDLHQIRPESVAWRILRDWGGPRTWIRQNGSPVVEMRPWGELVASLSKNRRSTVGRTLRRAEKEGIHVARVEPDDAASAAQTLVACTVSSGGGGA